MKMELEVILEVILKVCFQYLQLYDCDSWLSQYSGERQFS